MHDRERLGAYLERIGYTGRAEPTLDALRAMHRAHFYTVPFENLSIQRGERIVVDPAENYRKVVDRQRGGFCLELTGLFGWALREIGFEVDLLGAQVMHDGEPGAERSHMVLHVRTPGEDTPWIADVGFGGMVAGPLPLQAGAREQIESRTYSVALDGDRWSVTCEEPWSMDDTYTYVFAVEPLDYDGFEPVCDWLQTSPDSHFTMGDIVSLARPDGRVTYAGGRLIESSDAGRSETPVPEEQLPVLMRERFGILL